MKKGENFTTLVQNLIIYEMKMSDLILFYRTSLQWETRICAFVRKSYFMIIILICWLYKSLKYFIFTICQKDIDVCFSKLFTDYSWLNNTDLHPFVFLLVPLFYIRLVMLSVCAVLYCIVNHLYPVKSCNYVRKLICYNW